MERMPCPPHGAALDIYIYDYLMRRNLTTTAKAFIKEAQERSFVTDVNVIDIPGGLSEWWSTFWESYVSVTDGLLHPEGDALEQKQLEMGHHYIQEEEQMQQRDASLGNLSGSVVSSDRMHQGLVTDSSQMHSQLSHQLAGIGGMCFPNSAAHLGFFGQDPIDLTALEHMQQLYQQSTRNMSLVSSSHQDVTNMHFALLGSGMDECITGISSQTQNLEDNRQLYQRNDQQTEHAVQQGNLLSAKYEKMNQGHMRVLGDILEGENAVNGPIRTSPLQDDEGPSDMLDLSGDVSVKKTAGIIYDEVIDLKVSSKKIFCCDFSSDGKFLASAGDESKVVTWNFSNILEKHTWEAQTSFISDISFQPNSTVLATTSSDKTVRLWDVSQTNPSCQTLVGHSSRVRSVDFHPFDPSFLCSSDDSGKIFFWTIGRPNPHICGLTGRAKVRFHPHGDTIASAIGSTANIIHVEKDKRIRCMQGNNTNKLIQSICWNERGEWLATVSEDCVRVWSQRGEHVRELSENLGFLSCAFHPTYPNTLVIGGYQTVTLWNFAENKRVSVQPHSCYISDLAECRATGLIASASHDGSIKIAR